MTKIKDWLELERPREKLLARGAAVLTDSELLAVMMRTGTGDLNCLEWSRLLLSQNGGLRQFFNLKSAKLSVISGMGPSRTAMVLAMREIMTRYLRAEITPRTVVRDPQVLAEYLKLSIGSAPREIFKVIFLNKKLEILSEKELFEGTVDETPVYPREVVEHALTARATAIILAHNHPSGRVQPSPEDIRITEKVSDACALVGIKVIDHLILGMDAYFSFADEGLLRTGSRDL